MISASNTYQELVASGVVTAIIAVGAIEQHGPHLPLGTDWMLADAVAQRVGEKLDAYVLPAVPFGASQAHLGFRGSVWLEHDTLAAVVKDLARCLIAQGFHRIVILNIHGGNIVLKVAVRDLNFDQSEGRVILVHPLLAANKELSRVIESLATEAHAGELETSLMLHLHDDLVQGEGPDEVPDAPADYFDYLPLQLVSTSGIWGRASLATEDKGRQAMESLVERTVKLVSETFDRLEQIERHK
jgi:creatinine amidohydrolase